MNPFFPVGGWLCPALLAACHPNPDPVDFEGATQVGASLDAFNRTASTGWVQTPPETAARLNLGKQVYERFKGCFGLSAAQEKPGVLLVYQQGLDFRQYRSPTFLAGTRPVSSPSPNHPTRGFDTGRESPGFRPASPQATQP